MPLPFSKASKCSEIITQDSSSLASSTWCYLQTSQTTATSSWCCKVIFQVMQQPRWVLALDCVNGTDETIGFTFSSVLLSDPGSTLKTLTCLRSGCLPLLVSRTLACFGWKKVQWYHKNMWKYMSLLDFLFCCPAQHVFAAWLYVAQLVRSAKWFAASCDPISSAFWTIRADIILEAIAFTVKIPVCLLTTHARGSSAVKHNFAHGLLRSPSNPQAGIQVVMWFCRHSFFSWRNNTLSLWALQVAK